MEDELDSGRVESIRPTYVGRCCTSIRNRVVGILADDDGEISLRLQSRLDEEYERQHYHHDTFVLDLCYDEMAGRAQYCRLASYYKSASETSTSEDTIDSFRWQHDPSNTHDNVFSKKEGNLIKEHNTVLL